MLRPSDLARFAARFGVSDAQIRRDHVISHVLAALPAFADDELHFFGGTALCRTYLDGQRLSEDVDLLHVHYKDVLAEISAGLPRALRREFPGARVERGGLEGEGVQAYVVTSDVPSVKLYVGAAHRDRPGWCFAPTSVNLRYPDLAEAVELSCPTPATFVAMKLEAYYDRHLPRDLFDLAGLARLGALDAEAEKVLRTVARFGFLVEEFARVPESTVAAWDTELAHQVAELISPEQCRATIMDALVRAQGDPVSDNG
jgi:hypothetical protein